ncbi:MAG: divalent-cation tolerance protein CutA [Gemmatimonadota bacterium]
MRVLLMTAPNAQVAESIVGSLVAERLIACGNITVPVVSIYRWQGETERASEVLVIMKTTEAVVARVAERVAELHPYEVPEVLSLGVLEGHAPYLGWVRDSVEISNH